MINFAAFLILFNPLIIITTATKIDKISPISNFNEEMIQNIGRHLERNDEIQLSKTSRDNYIYLNRHQKIKLSLPLEKSKSPSFFLCEQLKTKRNLEIEVLEDYDYDLLAQPDSIEMQYLKCLTGIWNLDILEATKDKSLLADPNFNVYELFPHLKYLGFCIMNQLAFDKIPNNLNHLKIWINFDDRYLPFYKSNELQKKISNMKHLKVLSFDIQNYKAVDLSFVTSTFSVLLNLPFFMSLKINYKGFDYFDLFDHFDNINYAIELDMDLTHSIQTVDLFQKFPQTIEKINLVLIDMQNMPQLCHYLSNLKNLKYLALYSQIVDINFDCLFKVLPESLIHFELGANFYLAKYRSIPLPRNLESLKLHKISISALESVASNVKYLKVIHLADPENLDVLRKPITHLKTLILGNWWGKPLSIKTLLNFYRLLPKHMELLDLDFYIRSDEDIQLIEKEILSNEKIINKIKLRLFWKVMFSVEWIFLYNGEKMIKLN